MGGVVWYGVVCGAVCLALGSVLQEQHPAEHADQEHHLGQDQQGP